MSNALQPVKLFYSYARRDEGLRNHLETHLSILRQQGIITEWYDRKLVAGTTRKQSVEDHLLTAAVILLLISPDYLASDYCSGIEMQLALARHARGDACVIPVILRPVDWKGAPFAHLHCVPKDNKPVTTWTNRDEAFRDVAISIRTAVERIHLSRSASLHSSLDCTDPLLAPLPSQQTSTTFGYHTCALSYAVEDQIFVEKLYTDLIGRGISCWFAPHDLKIGGKKRLQIYEAIQKNEKLLLVLSKNAVKSDWVEREVELAFEQESSHPEIPVLFPIRIDDAVMYTNAVWAGDIRRMRFIGDFRNFQDSTTYQRALRKLLDDLRHS